MPRKTEIPTDAEIDRCSGLISGLHVEVLRGLAKGQSYQAIADGLDIPVGTVRSRINRARAAMKVALTKESRK